MYRYTRCSLEYIEGVVRLSGSSAGVERMCLRTRRVRELRGRIETHHRGASVPFGALLVWRIMVEGAFVNCNRILRSAGLAHKGTNCRGP